MHKGRSVPFFIATSIMLTTALSMPYQAYAATAQTAKLAQAPSRRTLSYLNAIEVAQMPDGLRLQYFQALQTYLTALEEAMPLGLRNSSTKTAWLDWLIPEAQALREGDACVIGGYFSRWHSKNGRMSCALPESSSQENDRAPLTRDGGNTQCGSGKMTCNPRVYGFAADGKRHCVNISPTLSKNCNAAFVSRYNVDESLLKKDVAKLLSNPQEQASYNNLVQELTSLEGQLSQFEAEGTIDSTQRASLDAAREPLRRMIEAAKGLKSGPPQPGPQQGPPQPGPPQPEPQQPTSTQPPPPNKPSVSVGWPPRPAFRPPQPLPRPLPRPPQDHPTLGRELSCVLHGLQATGHSPSDRYIALIGTAVQHYDGPFDTRNDEERRRFQEHVISMIQAYGYCDSSSYPALTDRGEALQVRRWLTADNGSIRETGTDYIARAAADESGSSTGQRRLGEIFGLTDSGSIGTRPDFRGLFKTDWKDTSLAERQRLWSESLGSEGNLAQWKSCRENARARLNTDPAFKLQVLPGGKFYLDPLEFKDAQGNQTVSSLPYKYNEKLTAAKQDIDNVLAYNQFTCQAMVAYCGVSSATCQAPIKATNSSGGFVAPSIEDHKSVH